MLAVARASGHCVQPEDKLAPSRKFLGDLHQSRRPEVVNGIRPSRIDVERETAVGAHTPVQIHDDLLRTSVAAAGNPMVADRDVCGVHDVLHEEIPSVRQLPRVPRQLLDAASERRVVELGDKRRLAELRGTGSAIVASRRSSLKSESLERGIGRSVRPDPQEAVRLHRGHCSARCFGVCHVSLLKRLGRLGDGCACTGRVEAPRMICAQQLARVLDTPFAQWRHAVGACINKDAPLPSLLLLGSLEEAEPLRRLNGWAVIPQDYRPPKEREWVRPRGIQVFGDGDGIPILKPIELLLVRLACE
mmetsp:Transcript_31318/g.101188  ORF Transcript_31318/g.101188 Transcript_31318/m.101188 type:complete len:304 (-) Transcript_31318:203-1114(-)|eukprot:scaffold1316_cov130-Isochrysis_galbana.AAC.7